MKRISHLQNLSPALRRVLIASLAVAPFVLVNLFPAQLYRTTDIAAYLLFHNIAESFSIMVSFSIFGIGWFTFDQSRNRQILFISCAFLAIGLLDLMHMLSFPGMPNFVSRNSVNTGIQFWLAARLVAALAFLGSAWLKPETSSKLLAKGPLLIWVFAIPGLTLATTLYLPNLIPVFFVEGSGLTTVKIATEYFIVLILAVAAGIYWWRSTRTGEGQRLYYLTAFMLCIFSELALTLYKSAFDSYNLLGHLYKVVAFYLIYRGIFIATVQLPYRKVVANKEALRESENRYRSLFENNYALMLVIDPESGAIVDANPAASIWYGWKHEELCRKKISEINTLPPDEIQKEMDLARTEQRSYFQFQHRRADGSVRDVEVYSGTVTVTGRALLYSIVHDITAKIKAETEIRALNTELERRVSDRTEELAAKLAEIERMNKLFIDREFRIKELKEQLQAATKRAGALA